MFQHTAARRRLDSSAAREFKNGLFQHTAARRRLAMKEQADEALIKMFQHTAARRRLDMPCSPI